MNSLGSCSDCCMTLQNALNNAELTLLNLHSVLISEFLMAMLACKRDNQKIIVKKKHAHVIIIQNFSSLEAYYKYRLNS